MTNEYRGWIDWSKIVELRQKYPNLDIVDFDELKAGDKFIRFLQCPLPQYPRYYIKIQPEGSSAANARCLNDDGRHIITRWGKNAIPVVRLTEQRYRDIQDDMNTMI